MNDTPDTTQELKFKERRVIFPDGMIITIPTEPIKCLAYVAGKAFLTADGSSITNLEMTQEQFQSLSNRVEELQIPTPEPTPQRVFVESDPIIQNASGKQILIAMAFGIILGWVFHHTCFT